MKWMFYLNILLTLAICSSCRSIKYVPVETIRTDSLYLTVHERDSVHIHDSVYVKEQGDTVFVNKWHTVYRDRTTRDTTYIEREKEVQVPYPGERELTWWQKAKIEFGEFSIGIIFVLSIVVVWLIKKKGGAK